MMHVRHVLGFEHGDVFQALARFGVRLAQLAEERRPVPLGLFQRDMLAPVVQHQVEVAVMVVTVDEPAQMLLGHALVDTLLALGGLLLG